jgi:hypothetical protein
MTAGKSLIYSFFAPALLLFCVQARAIDEKRIAWVEDFSNFHTKNNINFPANWTLKSKPGTPISEFSVVRKDDNNSVLFVKSDRASGTILRDMSGEIDLTKTPVIRWRWKVKSLPPGADGRYDGKDDQAVAIYVGTGLIRQESIGYRWETETPKGFSGDCSYGAGFVKVKWYCVRNKTDATGKWYIEERNVAEDFKNAYGYIPKKFAISVVSNSQYTNSKVEAELHWIEFIPAVTTSTASVSPPPSDEKSN